MNQQKRDDYWEEILSTVSMDFIPLEYINTVVVTFRDGKVWDIDVEKSSQETDVEGVLDEFFQEYDEQIETVDFRLDTDKLKKDVSKRTAKFMKLNK